MNNKYSLPKDGGLIAESTPRDIIHRYEKIHTTVYENEYLGVQYVADTIVKAIRTYNELHCSNEVYEEQQPFEQCRLASPAVSSSSSALIAAAASARVKGVSSVIPARARSTAAGENTFSSSAARSARVMATSG